MSKGGRNLNKFPTPRGKSNAGYSRKIPGTLKRLEVYNDSVGKERGMYDKLPGAILNLNVPGAVAADTKPNRDQKGPTSIVEFMAAIAAASGAKTKSFTPYFFLDKKKLKKKPMSWNRKVPFSVAEKRKLGLHLLPKKSLAFENFVPLHSMWKEYIVDLLNIKEMLALGFQSLPCDGRWAETSLQLLRADYHGAFVTVCRSRCPAHVGTSGIVVMDTKNTVKIIGQDDIVRTIPKDSSVFVLDLNGFELTVFGKYLCVRPAERSVKKIKARMCADL